MVNAYNYNVMYGVMFCVFHVRLNAGTVLQQYYT